MGESCLTSGCSVGETCVREGASAACVKNEAAFTVDSCAGLNGINEACYFRYRYASNPCAGGKCSKLLIFFSGGEMNCDDSADRNDSGYSKVLRGYNEKGYLAVCAGVFLSSEAGGSFPLHTETGRINRLVRNIMRSESINKLWTGEHLLIGGISHGATAPVVAMARTNIEDQPNWKGKITTGACFLDGVYSPIEANALLKTQPIACNDVRERVICERYYGSSTCPDPTLRNPDVALDEVTSTPGVAFNISNWKLVECGSNLPACRPFGQGDMVPKGPIQKLCSSLNSSAGKSCTFGSLPNESHMSCMSSPTGIAQCRDWFDQVVNRPKPKCASLQGNWLWDSRAFPANFSSSNTVQGIDNSKALTATWSCDPASQNVVVHWSNGFVDTLVRSADELTLTGTNGFANVSAKKVIGQLQGACSRVPGNWLWGDQRMQSVLSANGNARRMEAGKNVVGNWYCTSPQGEIVVKWSTGNVDHLQLANGFTLNGFTHTNPSRRLTATRGF